MSRTAQNIAHFCKFRQAACRADASARMDNSEPLAYGHGLVTARHVKFLVNVLGVTFYGRPSDIEPVRNLLIAQLFREQLQDFELSLRQGMLKRLAHFLRMIVTKM